MNGGHFTMLYDTMFDSPAALTLSEGALALLVGWLRLWGRATGNGERPHPISFCWSGCARLISRQAFDAHREELLGAGFIRCHSRRTGLFLTSDAWRNHVPDPAKTRALSCQTEARRKQRAAKRAHRDSVRKPGTTPVLEKQALPPPTALSNEDPSVWKPGTTPVLEKQAPFKTDKYHPCIHPSGSDGRSVGVSDSEDGNGKVPWPPPHFAILPELTRWARQYEEALSVSQKEVLNDRFQVLENEWRNSSDSPSFDVGLPDDVLAQKIAERLGDAGGVERVLTVIAATNAQAVLKAAEVLLRDGTKTDDRFRFLKYRAEKQVKAMAGAV